MNDNGSIVAGIPAPHPPLTMAAARFLARGPSDGASVEP
jgi:hypothetical protein